MSNPTLEEHVHKLVARGRKRLEVLREIWKKVESGELGLRDPSPPRDFASYMKRPDYSTWYWVVVGLTLATVLLVYATEVAAFLTPARYVLGALYVLFLPGYALVEALYPESRSLTPLERAALSIGLSLAVVPLIGLVLNYTPWGIRLASITASISMYTIAIATLAAYRKYKLNSIKASEGVRARQAARR